MASSTMMYSSESRWYMLEGDSNYSDVDVGQVKIEVLIKKLERTRS